MAKTELVISEIMAEAHRLEFLISKAVRKFGFNEILVEAIEVAQSLTDDLESINLPSMMHSHRRRGKLIQKEQEKRHTRRVLAHKHRDAKAETVATAKERYADNPILRHLIEKGFISLKEAAEIDIHTREIRDTKGAEITTTGEAALLT